MKASFETHFFASLLQAKTSKFVWISCFLKLIYSINHITVCLSFSHSLHVSLEYVCTSEDQFSVAGVVSMYHDSIKTNENSCGHVFSPSSLIDQTPFLIPLATSSCPMPLRHSSVLRKKVMQCAYPSRPTLHHTGTVKVCSWLHNETSRFHV